jgi:hypothetical protein
MLFEMGVSGYIIKHFNASLGFKLQIAAGSLSGANNEDKTYFEGNYKSLRVYLQRHLSHL